MSDDACMAANPYIVTTDRLTTQQLVEIFENAIAQVSTVGKAYMTGSGGAQRQLSRADLPDLMASLKYYENKLDQEAEASSGSGGASNLVKFARPN